MTTVFFSLFSSRVLSNCDHVIVTACFLPPAARCSQEETPPADVSLRRGLSLSLSLARSPDAANQALAT